MTKVNLAGYVMIILGGGLAVGCGDDQDSSDSGGHASGVNGQKRLTDLTDEDSRKLCEYAVQQYRRLALASEDQYCTVVGIDTSADADDCEQSKQECIDGTDYEDERDYDGDCAAQGLFDDDIEGPCTITVADVEACVREDAEREGAIGTNYTCANANDDIPEEEGEGPACAKVSDKCPGADF